MEAKGLSVRLKFGKYLGLLALALGAIALVKPCANADDFKVGYLYVGPVDDYGYNYAQNQARLMVQKEVPGVITQFVENVPENADADRVMERMINGNFKMIFATSYGYYNDMVRLAAQNHGVIFEHCGGPKAIDPNVGTYFSDVYQAVYLSGMTAGKMTKTGKLGYVAAHPIPQVLNNINAFELGAQSVNPSVKTYVIFTGDWADPPKESAAAQKLISIGADVLTDHQDNPIPVARVAETNHIYFAGYESDASKFAPKGWLTGAIFNWGPTEVKLVSEAMKGTWKPEHIVGSISDGMVKLAPFGPAVPADVQSLVLSTEKDFIAGKKQVFAGPLKDASGKEIVPAGQTMASDRIVNMNFFLDGVEGSIQ
jgi:basic membrane protein A and related proteins